MNQPTAIPPVTLNLVNLEELKSVLTEWGFMPLQAQVEKEEKRYEEVTRKDAIRILSEKGYRASSCRAFNSLMDEHSIRGKRKRKVLWYARADIERIPTRT